MSGIDRTTKPLLKPLMAGMTMALGPQSISDLVIWLVKFGMVAEWASDDPNDRYFDQQERDAFRQHRTIPAGTYAWIGHHDHLLGPWSHGFRLRMRFFPENPSLPPTDHDGQVFTLCFGHLVAQVLFDRDDVVRAAPEYPRVLAYWKWRTIELWPNADQKTWPPEAYLNDESLEPFANRWMPAH